MRRYVIIGGGAAGIGAVEAIRSQDGDGEILLVSDDPHGYYSRPGLAYYLTGELPEQLLFPFSEQDFSRLNVRRLYARATQIYADEHRITLQDGSSLPYDRLLIAMGATAAPLKQPGAELDGVVKLDNLTDARRIVNLARRGRTAVVVGGGITALEIVEGLVSRGVRTHYFLRGDRYWSNVLDEAESRVVEHRLIKEGVKIHYHTDLEAIIGKGGRVKAVRTRDGRQMKCDLVAYAIGIRPRKELAESAGIKVERGILVDERLQSSAADVFAAGDVAQVYDPFTGQSVLDSLWGPAREQGHYAGLNMAGGSAMYEKLIAFNVTRLANLTTTIIGTIGHGTDDDLLGIARGDSEIWRQLPDAIAAQAGFDINHLRVQVGERTIQGALLMGDQTFSRPLLDLVTRQTDISTVRESLLQPQAPVGDILADFWTQLKAQDARL